MGRVIYLAGSLRHARVEGVAAKLRKAGYVAFDDWRAAGEEADDAWRDYCARRGHGYAEALRNPSARNIFEFDVRNIRSADAFALVMPAGKSAHMELGFASGIGKPCFVLFDPKDPPERFDVMYNFAHTVCFDTEALIVELDEWFGTHTEE